MMMTNKHQRRSKHRVSAQSVFRVIKESVGCIACVAILVTLGSGQVVYGQDNAAIQDLGMLRFESEGRVQIEVIDPNGNTVSRDANEIEGAVFIDDDIRSGSIEIPHSVPGDYQLHVNVSGSVNRLQHFGVLVTDGISTIQLADNELIVNVPTDAYIIRNSETGIEIATQAEEDNPGMSNSLMWILVGSAGLLVGIGIFIVRSRKRKR